MTSPLVSIIMPVYNAGEYLEVALRSILRQTYAHLQIVCIDDGSTDGSGEVLERMGDDPRVEVVHTANQGTSAASNLALSLAKGVFIARMDADDISAVDRIERQVRYLQQHPEIGFLGSQTLLTTREGLPVRLSAYAEQHDLIEQALLRGMCPISHSSIMLRREVYEALQGYRNCQSEDYDLFLRACGITRLANLPEALVTYRVSSEGLKHSTLLSHHVSILASLREAMVSRSKDVAALVEIEAQFLSYQARMMPSHALLHKQLRDAWHAGNIVSVKVMGRKLFKLGSMKRKSLHRWIRAEAACLLGGQNKHLALAEAITGKA